MRLSVWVKLSYGVGHVLNDLCASMWFTYLLVFYKHVVGFTSPESGIILFIGQIADALSTPVVGILSDRGKSSWILKYGKRKTWHLVGTICVLCSVPFMYSPCIGCENSKKMVQLIYYSVFVVIFQFGWASVQISHLSLVPDLTPSEAERTSLLSIRYSFTVLSNMAVYLITWGVLEIAGSGDRVSSDDMIKFQEITYIICGIGAVTSILFHACVREIQPEPLLQGDDEPEQRKRMPLKQLLGNIKLYEVAVIYMAARLFCNISQSLVPMYIHDVLQLGAQSLAIIPFVMYLSSFCTSLVTGYLNTHFGRRIAILLGSLIGIGGSIWVWFGQGETFTSYIIYVIAIIFGSASSILLITSLAITADLIGGDVGNGALVYGLMSFVDKLSSGVAIMIVQDLVPTTEGPNKYYQNALAYVCGGSAVLALLFIVKIPSPRRPEDIPTAEITEEIHDGPAQT